MKPITTVGLGYLVENGGESILTCPCGEGGWGFLKVLRSGLPTESRRHAGSTLDNFSKIVHEVRKYCGAVESPRPLASLTFLLSTVWVRPAMVTLSREGGSCFLL